MNRRFVLASSSRRHRAAMAKKTRWHSSMYRKLADPIVSSFRKQTENIPVGPGYRASKVTPSKDFLQQDSTSNRFHDPLKQHHLLGTKCSNTWACGAFYSQTTTQNVFLKSCIPFSLNTVGQSWPCRLYSMDSYSASRILTLSLSKNVSKTLWDLL